ncbi:MAG: VOC family protein, partial [Deltaproteobacteria bacterium]|nr:VOC family protein [Deltaproteobacteria bacterium]
DIDAAHKELSEKGVVCVKPPVDAGDNRIAFFKGPDDIVFEVLQPI